MLSVKQGGIKYIFWVFGMTRPGIELRSPGLLTNTLTAKPMNLFQNITLEKCINSLILTAMSQIVSKLFFYMDGYGVE